MARHLIKAALTATSLAIAAPASAADILFDFQFDALGNFAATNIVYAADNLDPSLLTYVSGDVNGATSSQLRLAWWGPVQRSYEFVTTDFNVPVGTVIDMFFSLNGPFAVPPFAVGQTYETNVAGRAIRTNSGATYQYTTGRLTISERVAAVPEPSVWAMLVIGFGLLGGALRTARRRPTVTVTYA